MDCEGFSAEGEVSLLGAHVAGRAVIRRREAPPGPDRRRAAGRLGHVLPGGLQRRGRGEPARRAHRRPAVIRRREAPPGAQRRRTTGRRGHALPGGASAPRARCACSARTSPASCHSTAQRSTKALIADGLQVDQSMFCEEGFSAGGEVRLLGAHIAGQLSFDGATLHQGADRRRAAGRPEHVLPRRASAPRARCACPARTSPASCHSTARR